MAYSLRLELVVLEEHIVGEKSTPFGSDAERRFRGESLERFAGESPDAPGRTTENRGYLAIALVLPQDQLEDHPVLCR